jgi:hypothetical protein
MDNNIHKLSIICVLLLFGLDVNAQIYKWVDAKGQTHYSEKKDVAGPTKAAEIKIQPAPATPVEPSQEPAWREQERQFQQRQAQKPPERTQSNGPTASGRGASFKPGDESNKGKCDLARAIIDGTAKHRNGARTDKNDLDTAKSDTQLFCR